MTNRDDLIEPADERSQGERSMTKRMLDLIHRFDAEERRGRNPEVDSDSGHRRRRDDTHAASPATADDLVVGLEDTTS